MAKKKLGPIVEVAPPKKKKKKKHPGPIVEVAPPVKKPKPGSKIVEAASPPL